MKIQGSSQTTSLQYIAPSENTDRVAKSLHQQIQQLKQKMDEMNGKEELSVEEKLEQQKQIQTQIEQLQQRLMQHQMEVRQQQQEERKQEMEEAQEAQKTDKEGVSLSISEEGMDALIQADQSIKSSKASEKTATEAKGRERVLESEIQLDQARGIDTTEKENEYNSVHSTAVSATARQIHSLTYGAEKMQKVAEDDRSNERTKEHEKSKYSEEEKRELQQKQNVQATLEGQKKLRIHEERH